MLCKNLVSLGMFVQHCPNVELVNMSKFIRKNNRKMPETKENIFKLLILKIIGITDNFDYSIQIIVNVVVTRC